jgi:DNA-binding beta-propeller fold protein YncE
MDETTHAVFVTDRDWNGTGALTRVGLDSSVTRVSTGETAEGLAVDERRQIIYVANTNDGTIAFVDARSMRVIRRYPAVARVFSLALSPDGTRLYAISNEAMDSPFGKAGEAMEISLGGPFPRIAPSFRSRLGSRLTTARIRSSSATRTAVPSMCSTLEPCVQNAPRSRRAPSRGS